MDRDNQIMRIPRKVMETIIEEKRQQAEGQKKKAESKILYGHISTQVQMVDYATKTRRRGLVEDIHDGIAVVEELEYIKECNAIVIPMMFHTM